MGLLLIGARQSCGLPSARGPTVTGERDGWTGASLAGCGASACAALARCWALMAATRVFFSQIKFLYSSMRVMRSAASISCFSTSLYTLAISPSISLCSWPRSVFGSRWPHVALFHAAETALASPMAATNAPSCRSRHRGRGPKRICRGLAARHAPQRRPVRLERRPAARDGR
ncbi:hypothetical protein M885DRAFT_510347 [Pelagophyceae sp. CCMP2097]|nr:hypothetical protein M885DRAFT_510347 [Pelagophyceae sp. CCMP2097]